MQRILVVDDEHDITAVVEQGLRREGFQVSIAHDGIAALMCAGRDHPDLIVLDVTMPRLDGWQVCQSLRRDTKMAQTPIIFLSGCTSVEDRLRGFAEGADDYLTKPFDIRELRARIHALLRRSIAEQVPAPQVISCAGLHLNPKTGEAAVDGRSVQLTPAELELLHYLMLHPNQAFSSQHLLKHVWGYAPETADLGLVRWHVMNLRMKIELNPSQPQLLRTVPRHGYMLRA